MSGSTPELVVVVDTEEEFDWTKPFDRTATATKSIPAQERAQAIYDEMGIVPTYVTGYPVARDPTAVAYLRRLQEEGRAEIGAHLHPWVTPPHREKVGTHNSYECNLPPALERAKIEVLTDALEGAFGRRPTIFKAGRHGFSRQTARLLVALGYKVDCSMLPRSDLRGDGGPDFRRVPDVPFWLDPKAGLLEVPVTTGFMGSAPRIGTMLSGLFDSPRAALLRLPGMLARSGLVARSRLTPEGVSADEQCHLLDALVRQGRRTFTLVYHSPSLAPGHTPYVRNEAELARFVATISEVLTYFRDAIGGRFTTLSAIHVAMSEARTGATAPAAPQSRPAQLPPVAAAAAAAGRGARG